METGEWVGMRVGKFAKGHEVSGARCERERTCVDGRKSKQTTHANSLRHALQPTEPIIMPVASNESLT